MRLDLSAKLRQVLGHAKDHASIGRAIVQNYNEKGLFDIEVAVVRATSHDDCPVDDKTMHEILFLVSNTPGSIPFLAEQISRRLAKTRDCLVAGKTLLLFHRLLRGSSRRIEQQLHIAHTSGHLQIGCCWFMMSTDPSFVFLQNYVAYLQERVGWIINQAGKLEPIMSGGTKFSRYKEKSMDLVFHILPKCQEFIAKVLNCSPVNTWPTNNLVQAATGNILKESFQVYMTYSDGIAALINMLFDLSRPARALAFEILRKASQQIQDLCDLYEKCKGFARTKNLDYPSVQPITLDHIVALEECSSYTPAGSVLMRSEAKEVSQSPPILKIKSPAVEENRKSSNPVSHLPVFSRFRQRPKSAWSGLFLIMKNQMTQSKTHEYRSVTSNKNYRSCRRDIQQRRRLVPYLFMEIVFVPGFIFFPSLLLAMQKNLVMEEEGNKQITIFVNCHKTNVYMRLMFCNFVKYRE